MLSIIIPTLNAGRTLPATFAALMPALIDGMISEVIVADGGSTDQTEQIAESCGANFIQSPKAGRGEQLATGAAAAKSSWLLFLHADTELEDDWHEEVRDFIKKEEQKDTQNTAAFTFALQDKGLKPALLERLVALRCRLFALPYGDQALLISAKTYQLVGGFAPLPIMEDVDLIHRLSDRLSLRPTLFKSRAFTSAERYQQTGYLKRSLRNLYCLASYYRGIPAEKIKTVYDKA